jgi:predicted dienelactone hydrolase
MRTSRRLTAGTAVLIMAIIGVGAHSLPSAVAGSGGTGFALSHGGQRFAVGEIVVTYTDRRRHVTLPDGRSVPRSLTTIIRYPAVGSDSGNDRLAAAPAKSARPFPLIVFAHGFNITPAPYASMLRAWVGAGFVVAAPIFPLTNAAAPGGPNESDLVNQPTDMSFVITRMLAGSARSHGILSRLIAPREVAVTGQSDGGSTALAAAYNIHYFDRRVRAAMILSGARMPGVSGYDFAEPSPPLLAVQGTGDTVNAPSSTYRYFGLARQPKFLLSLLGAPHLGPYTNEQPQLGIVERVTLAFLDRYLKRQPGARARMWKDGNVPSLASLSS